jgi:hypothetical protein
LSFGLACVLSLACDKDYSKTEATPLWRSYAQAEWSDERIASIPVEQATRTGDRDFSYWFLLVVPGEEIDSVSQLMREKLKPTQPARKIYEAGINPKFPTGDAPGWWRPRDIPDVTLLSIVVEGFGYDIYFSKSKGRIYVHIWTS